MLPNKKNLPNGKDLVAALANKAKAPNHNPLSASTELIGSMNALSMNLTPAKTAAFKQPSRNARRRQNQHVNALAKNSVIYGYMTTTAGGVSSSAGSTSSARVIPRVISTTFHPYTRLPNELKTKVIALACQEPRIIEIEYGPDRGDEGTGPYVNAHHRRRVCSSPPSILQVGSLAREVALKIYKLRTFDSHKDHRREIYFNKDADGVYFGENSCVATIPFMLLWEADIPKVAINCSTKMEACIDDYDHDAYYVDGGFDESVCHHKNWDVNIGLTDVYFVVKSNLWRTEAGKMHAGIEMRGATNGGLTDGQRRYKRICDSRIERVKDGRGMYGVGENKWVGEKQPKFHFASFGPKIVGVDSRVYDGICVSRYAIGRLTSYQERQEKCKYNDLKSVRYFARQYNVEITIPEPGFPQEDPREIGFFGLRDAVDKAKVAIRERVESKLQKSRR